jgi:hypothetical protein
MALMALNTWKTLGGTVNVDARIPAAPQLHAAQHEAAHA